MVHMKELKILYTSKSDPGLFYFQVLRAIGITPMVAIMVMRSDMMLTIYEDIDHQWKILTETSIRAKSIRGYRTRNFKMTANKFNLNEPKPELLEDWDPR